jgi:DNA-directed RNA polymerase specialized sigma24 family protein
MDDGTVHSTDDALLLSGDLEDFGRFNDRYVKALLAFFQRRVRDPEVAADLTAETFAAAMVSRGRYQAQTATAAAWLSAIAQHKWPTIAAAARRSTAWARGSAWSPSP